MRPSSRGCVEARIKPCRATDLIPLIFFRIGSQCLVLPLVAGASARPARPSWTAHEATRLGAGMLAVLQHLYAIDEHVLHTGRELLRLFEGGMVLDRGWVEDDDVGVIAGPQPAALP